MAIYTTLFLCHPDQLLAAFPGWKPPRAEPVRSQVQNPFTKEVVAVESWEPDWDGVAQEPVFDAEPLPRAIDPDGGYAAYLEGRLSDGVYAQPHFATKGLTEVELSPLLQALELAAEFRVPIYAPPSASALVQALPVTLMSLLAALDEHERTSVAENWAAAMSSPEYTRSMAGLRVSAGWSTADALSLLEPIAMLARQAQADERLYLLTEW